MQPPEVSDVLAGRVLVRASWSGTAVFAVSAVGAALSPATFDVVALVVALGLFFVGLIAFVSAYAVAVARSRSDEIVVSSLFLLTGSAPPRIRVELMGSLAVEVAAALVTAAVRPFTSLAFGVLVPVYALGLAGLWAARHGTFPPRRPAPRRDRQR